MKRIGQLFCASLAAVALSGAVHAQERSQTNVERDFLTRAERQMGATFHNLSITDFRPGPMPGLFEASIGGRVVYYSPEPELIIFGQIFDKAGKDLTAEALQKAQQRKMGAVDLKQALVLGPPGAPEIVEFTNPDCGFCRNLSRYLAVEAEQGRTVRRRIIFTTFNAASRRKAEHILCSKDPERAFEEIYASGAPKTLASCAEGKAKVEAHAQMARAAGVQATPTLWLDGRPVEGFRQTEVTAFLNSKRTAKK